MSSTRIIKNFPDYNAPGFDLGIYYDIYKNHNVIVHALSSDISFEEHWSTLTIKCAFGGDENFVSSGCRYKVRDKSFLIINDGCLYSSYINSASPVESLALFFNRNFASEIFHYTNSSDKELLDNPLFYKNYHPEFDICTTDSVLIMNYLLMLRTLLKRENTESQIFDYMMRGILESIIKFKISEIKFVADIPALTLSAKKELYKRLGRVRDYIHSNYNEDISLDILAKLACLCPNHLIRSFKKFYGITPHQYLIKVRIDSSQILLSESNFPVTEICNLVGFKSLGSFSSLFATQTGTPPLTYRREHGIKKSILKK